LLLTHWYRNLTAKTGTLGFDLVEDSLSEDCTNLDNDVLDPIDDLAKRVEKNVENDIGSDTSIPVEVFTCNITLNDLTEAPSAACSGITITLNVLT